MVRRMNCEATEQLLRGWVGLVLAAEYCAAGVSSELRRMDLWAKRSRMADGQVRAASR